MLSKLLKKILCSVLPLLFAQGVPPPTKPGSSLIILPLMRILQRNLKRTTDTFLFISHTTNVLLFKSRCNIFICFGIIKELPGLVGSGTPYICVHIRGLSGKYPAILNISRTGRVALM